MDGGGFSPDLAQFEIDQARRERDARRAARARIEPRSLHASAWIPLTIWLMASSTALFFFANA
ncbi:MAG: hypothetical protein AAF909_12125 [Pseudomonadota bacterium]